MFARDDFLPVIELLDMHGVKRSAVYLELVKVLKDSLIPRLNTLSQAQLEGMLDKTFPYISIEELSSVPMAIMMKLDSVKKSFLAKLASYEALYEKCPMKIKRQIWAVDAELFKQQLKPTLEKYMRSFEGLDASVNEMWSLKSSEDPLRRRKNSESLASLLSFVDKSLPLYRSLVSLCVKSYGTEANAIYCTLRSDILMALHDKGEAKLYSSDDSHDFAWILDSAVRERKFDNGLAKDLEGILSKTRSGNNDAWIDQCMLLANPFVQHVILRSICDCIVESVRERKLPKEISKIHLLFRLLIMGSSALACIRDKTQCFSVNTIRTLGKKLIGMLCPWLSGVLVDSRLFDGGALIPRSSENVPSEVVDFMVSESCARKMVYAFVLSRIEAVQPFGLVLLFSAIENALRLEDTENEACFFQSIVSSVLARTKMTSAKWKDVYLVASKFISSMSKYGLFAHKQALRFLVATLPTTPGATVLEFLQEVTSCASEEDQADDEIRLKYINILELLEARSMEEEKMAFVMKYLKLGEEENEEKEEDGKQQRQEKRQEEEEEEEEIVVELEEYDED